MHTTVTAVHPTPAPSPAWGLLRSWGDGGERQQLRPDASGSRPRAQCTANGGGASSRKAAELHRIVSPPTTASGSTDAPGYREEMRERSGSHGRRRYALRQGQKPSPAGPAHPEPQNQPPTTDRLRAARKRDHRPSPGPPNQITHSVHHAPLRPASDLRAVAVPRRSPRFTQCS